MKQPVQKKKKKHNYNAKTEKVNKCKSN